uniref:Helicase ATP-binding domain-containing protein n=1 Tax=viral metagenome TaxID=1070528 RepID=A0A6C0HUL8_9ZZZZ
MSSSKSKVTNSRTLFVPTETYQEQIRQGSYLGKKGYTIPKTILDPQDLKFLYQDLHMVPAKQGPSYGAPTDDNTAFPIYRENANKIYLPRFYGIARYGYPQERDLNLERVAPISCSFDKSLRDYQEVVVDSYLSHVQKNPLHHVSGGIITIKCGAGKCLSKDTKILMFDGTIKPVQDIVVGDQLMGDDSGPRNVLTLARGRETMYKVCTKRGEGYTVNESHILSLKHNITNSVLDISVLDYLSLLQSNDKELVEHLYGYRVPILFPETYQEMDPYLMGCNIGEDSIKGLLKPKTYEHIPLHYKCNSRKNQLELLAGLIDSIGYYDKTNNCYEIRQKNKKVLDDIMFLVRSLGFASYEKPMEDKYRYFMGIHWHIIIYGTGLDKIPVHDPTKKACEVSVQQIKDVLKYRIHLEKLPEDDYYGFEIDGNRRFVLGDFTVTHNTVMAIKIISMIAKKTLIVVHKEFLLNQWIERIQEFLPTAKIGRIQGPIFESKGKDIVIGMLQTLYDRDFPENSFDDFGLMIVDEVHRIGSCQFSKALLRIQIPLMLGVTATLERKDGLTKVIHHFMGPTVYSDTQGLKNEDGSVLVRSMTFVSKDAEFNDVATDYRGNTMFSTMITKLCNHGPRIRFLVQILADLVEETPEAQILVLGHNRSLLVELNDAIVGKEIATVGYYLGGMKAKALEDSTEKQIILATYAMASEGFDHKNLSVLVMVTPKTDIIQSVGRIFRKKHDRPLIVDVVDQHDVFQNQWRKRRAYYKKCGFRIHASTSEDRTHWKIVYEPKNVDHKPDASTTFTASSPNATVLRTSTLGSYMEDDNNTVPKGCMIQIDSTELLKEDW